MKKPIILVLALILLGVVGWVIPGGADWYEVVRPAARLFLAGRSPYSQPLWYAPVWGLIPFLPLALLPPLPGRAVLFIMSLSAYAYCVYKLKAGPLGLIAFLLSPPIVVALWLNSLDWLPLLGFVLPPPIGLFFVSLKPQLGIGVAAYWFVEACRKGWREVVRVFGPVSVALAVQLAVYGVEPFWEARRLVTMEHNVSLWPALLPVGLTLVVAAWRKREIRYAFAAGPCLSPYVMITSWAAVLVALSAATPELLTGVIGGWILVLLRVGF